jgi:hypothetical protein
MRWRSRGALAAVAFAAAGCGGLAVASHERQRVIPAATDTITVERGVVGRPIPSGFLGLSMEIRGIEDYTGTDPQAVDPVFEQLVRNLAPGQRPVLRLAGDSGDWTWYPVAHMRRPLGVRFAITNTWLKVVRAFAKALGAKLILGVNLEVDSARVAGAEAQALVHGLRPFVAALALGNEPELYGGLPWFVLNGHRYYGRPHSYDFPAYLQDYGTIERALPDVPLAGPDTGSPFWFPYVGQFLTADHRDRIATVHRYPLKKCSAGAHVTIGQLLSSASGRGLAELLLPMARAAHARGVPIRLDETNSVSCGGAVGVSNTFASSLWAFEALFEFARIGIDGVNFHTSESTANALFDFTHSDGTWHASVRPDYYGLVAFARAAPAGARLLHVVGASGSLQVWATRAKDGTVRVALINESTSSARDVVLRIRAASGDGVLEWLRAPRVGATGGVTLGGQSFGTDTTSGVLDGTHRRYTVRDRAGRYALTVPAASAAILTLGAGG